MTDPRTDELQARLEQVRERIRAACTEAGRRPAEVELIVVTKRFPAADVRRLATLGVRQVGENRHQEAAAKLGELPPDTRAALTVHFIGQLQSNKAAAVARYADVVHSVDRARLVAALARGAGAAGRRLSVLVQVDLAGDDAGRGGAPESEVGRLCRLVASQETLRLRGVMAVAPLRADPRVAFQRLARISAQVRTDHPGATWISAGMSHDLEDAVACGATHLRVGSAILGSRPPQR